MTLDAACVRRLLLLRDAAVLLRAAVLTLYMVLVSQYVFWY